MVDFFEVGKTYVADVVEVHRTVTVLAVTGVMYPVRSVVARSELVDCIVLSEIGVHYMSLNTDLRSKV